MRLIDADLLEDQFEVSDADLLALDEIRHAPTVDAVVVTRCKNCRSYNKPKTGWCEVHLDRENPDDFCSYGEPKEGTTAEVALRLASNIEKQPLIWKRLFMVA